MPSSRSNHIPTIVGIALRLAPTSILDVGVGFGKWGHLLREYTDIRLSEHDPARYARDGWKVRIDGIEGFESYLTPMHHFLYDRIYVGDMREVIDEVGRYEMILLGDVIEHVDKRDGEQLLRKCLGHCSGVVVVSTPSVFRPQKDACGNRLEIHRSFWKARDFKRFSRARVKVTSNDILVAVIPAPGVTVPAIAPPGLTLKERGSRALHRVRSTLGRWNLFDGRARSGSAAPQDPGT